MQKKPPLITYKCIYHKNKNGMGGRAINCDTLEKISIAASEENFALDQDEVIVSNIKTKEGSLYGTIQNVVKHNTTHLVGFIQTHKQQKLLRVTNPKFGNYLVVIQSEIDKVNREELFNTIIVSYPKDNQPYFIVKVLNAIGQMGEDQAFIKQAIIEANLPVKFSQASLEQTEKIPNQIKLEELHNRVDLRHLPFVTIDGINAKDFDDAVYASVEEGLFNLYVAIADVAHYVTHQSALDKDAYTRGTSVYFPKQVIPMLPEHLSNGLCSLNPQVDRLVMCCQMQINPNGKILTYKVYNGVICSKARLTYDQVQEWLNELSLAPNTLINNITNLYLTYQALVKSRHNRGAIDFESVEPEFVFDEQGIVSQIQPRIRLESHKLIEECMLAANVCIADFLLSHEHPGLFRIHDKPSEEKFSTLKNYLNSLAIRMDVSYANLMPFHYAKLLEQVHDFPQFTAIQQAVLRSMQLAVYSPKNIGHFGLSYDRYLHFTSPIRRYPDLLVHRAVKKVLNEQQYAYAYPLETMGEYTSYTERRAEDLSRKVDAFYKCQYAKTHLGSEFTGIITSIVNFGIFVYLPDLLVDGLVHITELGSDYFIFDPDKQVLVGKKTGIKYYTGQNLKIQIVNVDMAKLFIDLKLVSLINL